MSTYSFTGNKVSFTYQRLLQISDGGDGNPTGIIYDGYGATVTIADENINNLYTTVNNLISTGIAGSTGPTGVQGWQGPIGIGITGESITGPQGFTGFQGGQGLTGPQGFTGFQGSQGSQGFGFNTIYNFAPTRILTASGSNSANAESNLTFDGFTLSLHSGVISDVKYIDLDTTTASSKTGRIWFDSVERSLSYYPDSNQDVIVRTGQQLYTRVYNITGATISKGSAVKIISGTAGYPYVSLAIAQHNIKNHVVGLVADDIPNNNVGLIINNGLLNDINLTSYNIGDTLYLSDINPGQFVTSTNQFQSFSARTNEIGYVIDNSTSGKIYVNINNEDSNLTLTDIERNILEGNVISTGVYQFSPGITKISNTTFSVSEARGWVVYNTGSFSVLPEVSNVLFPGATGLSTPYLTTADSTYVLLTASASLTYSTTFPTPQQRRENIFLGKIVHPDRTSILNVNQTVDFDVSPMSALRDLWTPIKLINQGIIPSYHQVGSMSFNTSAGTLWGNGIGWTTNELNPNSVSILGKSPVTFQYRTRITGSTGSDITNIDPTKWDNNGVITTVSNPASTATNQRIYLFPTGLIRVQYGQKEYANLAAAVSGQQTEQFLENGNLRDNGILIGILSVTKGCTDLSDTTKAQFNYVSKWGEVLGGSAGLSTTTLQQAYDNSVQPEILTNSTLGAVTFRRGSSSDNDSVIEVQNNSGQNNFYVDGNGNTTTNKLKISNIGTTGSLTKYVVVDDSGQTYYQTTIIGGGGSTGPQGLAGATGAGGALGYWGSFWDTTIQTNAGATAANAMRLNSFDPSNNGVSVNSNTRVTVQYPGVYNIQFSAVFSKSNSSAQNYDVWIAKNGVNIPETNTRQTLAGSFELVAAWNFMLHLSASDYIELYWSSPDTTMQILSTTASTLPDRPAIPSVILTVQQVMYTQLGPTGSQGLQGLQGIEGLTGPQGFQGFQGIEGLTGFQGFQGNQGLTGPQGFQGFQGNQGIEGLTGPQGFQGNQGIEGLTGPQGFQGSTGDYSPFYYQDTAPSTTLPVGSRWFDSSTGEELVLIDDGDSKQWVQPYSSGSGGGGGGGGVGTQGPQGIGSTGTQGPQGLQGNTGPQGPGSSSFLYENVLFVHPNGDDNTAVVGDRSLPFNTLYGAINAASGLINPVIEVWPGDTYNPITPIYEYTENANIVISFDLTIYLKPGVHIQFLTNRSVTNFISVVSGARLNIVGDDKYSSLNVNLNDRYGSSLFYIESSNVYIENISIYYSYDEIQSGFQTAFYVLFAGKGVSGSVLSLKNCYIEFIEGGKSLITGQFHGFLNSGSTIEIDGCQLFFDGNSKDTSGFVSFIKNDIIATGCQNLIRNSQFLTLRKSESTAIFSVIFNDDPTDKRNSKTTIDDCIFYIDNGAGGKGAGPYVLASNTAMLNVSLVSRSIHNYAATDTGNIQYISGEPSSLGDLGIAGYGFLEQYSTINIPFVRK